MIDKRKSSSVSLTPRDLALLKNLYDMTALSFGQVWQRHFKEKSISTISNRLSRLERADLIARLRVPRLLGIGNAPQVSVLFQITKNGIRELQKRTFSEVLRDEPVKLHAHSIEHDLLLSDVMDALKIRFSGAEIIHGRLWNPSQMASGVYPDAIIEILDGKTKWAVELEMTLKSEQRYRDIVLKYRLANDFSKVIYVIGHPAIREKLNQVLGGAPLSSGTNIITGKFHFVDVKELLREPRMAAISNGDALLSKEVCA